MNKEANKIITAQRALKDDLSWDIDEFLEEPKIAFEYPIAYLKLLSPEIGFDWREVLAQCEDANHSPEPAPGAVH